MYCRLKQLLESNGTYGSKPSFLRPSNQCWSNSRPPAAHHSVDHCTLMVSPQLPNHVDMLVRRFSATAQSTYKNQAKGVL